MTTTSYPIVDANIDHAQWRELFTGTPGFFDPEDSGTFALTLSSTSDTATVGLGKYRFRGFAILVTAAHDLTLAAAVGSATTYVIGIMYDPALEADPAGPLYLAAPLSTAIVPPSGGDFCPLYNVTRQPSQVLSQATVLSRRQWTYAPAARFGGTLPAASEFGYGQLLLTDAAPYGAGLLDLLVRQGAAGSESWSALLAPRWNSMTLASGIVQAYSSVPVRYARTGGRFECEGAVARSSGAEFAQNQEYTVANFGATLAPSQTKRFNVDTNFVNTTNGWQMGARVKVEGVGDATPGRVSVSCPFATPVISLDGVSWFPKGA